MRSLKFALLTISIGLAAQATAPRPKFESFPAGEIYKAGRVAGRDFDDWKNKIRAETARIGLDEFTADAVAYLLATGTF